MAQDPAITGIEAGLSGDDQIIIALQTMIGQGGSVSMEKIYRGIEAQMEGYQLSKQGKASLRSFINKTAVEKNYVYSYNKKS